MADPFQFDLVSPERLLMSEPVAQVVVPGSEGQFTVLRGHAPLMTRPVVRDGVTDEADAGSQPRQPASRCSSSVCAATGSRVPGCSRTWCSARWMPT